MMHFVKWYDADADVYCEGELSQAGLWTLQIDEDIVLLSIDGEPCRP